MKEGGDFSDVTLVGEDASSFGAHKIVLSRASLFFESLLTNLEGRNSSNSVIIMTGFKEQHLKSLISFIYEGEAIIDPDYFAEFIQLVKGLNLLGLAIISKKV